MTTLEQILYKLNKQDKKLAEIMKRLSAPVNNSEWISAERAAELTGYKKDTLRKMNLRRKFKQSGRKPQYNINELKQRNLI